MTRRSKFVTRTKLMRERGWPADLVDAVLGEEAVLARNPHRSSGPNMRLYRLDEVEAAELRPNIRRALRFPPPPPQGRLSEAALRGVQAGWQEYVDALVPSVQIIPLDELRSASIASYLAWAEGRVMYPRNVSDENTVLGLMFGYVRRELVDWEAIAAALPAPLVPSDVKYICSDRIKAAIIEAYPSLAFPSR